MEFIESPKRMPTWPGICQWDPPSQTFYTSIRTCINCWNLSNVRPASVASSICDTFQDFNKFKFQRCEISFTFSAQKNITRSCCVHSQKVERKRDRIPHLWGSWIHASRAYGISKSRHRELARLLWQNHGEILLFISKGPRKKWKHAPLKTRPINFCLPLGQHLSLHLQSSKPFLGWPERRTRTQLDIHVKRKRFE